MTTLAAKIAIYFEAWHATTLETCLAKLDQVLVPDLAYRDPMFTHRSTRELAERIQTSRQTYPGFRVWVSTQIDGYDRSHRYCWTFTRDGSTTLEGLDILELADDGRIASIVSFFGSPIVRSTNEAIVQLPRYAPAS